ncbi:ribosomal RNA small subunit methyltransferase J [Acrasis kona]|uniref:Ribosomal RNA small subunit methyltransferase J n=1 Tax=Acrasis kona TaxID=1008807 RepID=A0AAW2ZDV0_9EUKA
MFKSRLSLLGIGGRFLKRGYSNYPIPESVYRSRTIVSPVTKRDVVKAQAFAKKFGLLYVDTTDIMKYNPDSAKQNEASTLEEGEEEEVKDPEYVVHVSESRPSFIERLHFHIPVRDKLTASADFVTFHPRSLESVLKRPMIRACRTLEKKIEDTHVVSCTAGLGADAYRLAMAGFKVTLVEKDPILFELLKDGHEYALNNIGVADVAMRMRLIHADFTTLTSEDLGPVDTFYISLLYSRKPMLKSHQKMTNKHDLYNCTLRQYSGYVKRDLVKSIFNKCLELNPAHKIVFKRPNGDRYNQDEISHHFNRYLYDYDNRYDICDKDDISHVDNKITNLEDRSEDQDSRHGDGYRENPLPRSSINFNTVPRRVNDEEKQ